MGPKIGKCTNVDFRNNFGSGIA